MCGIVGAVRCSTDAAPIDKVTVDAMRDRLAHRGPDGAATWLSDDGTVGLGFRRLAIVDLSPAAMQPMTNEDGSLRLVFNGEIYNHLDLRRQLTSLGHRFATDHADGETIVHAFEEWGIGCLTHFRGMFAFAIWDGRRRELWLARDRVGVKPLYWTSYGGRLAFASEIKALLTDPALTRQVDHESLYHHLSFLTVPAPRTIFKGINKLEAGSWLRLDARGQTTTRTWWDPWEETQPIVGASDEELAERLLAELRTAVSLRKMSDVPVGIFLSGGIDSSANAVLFNEGERERVETFSIGYDRDYASYRNELDWARRVASLISAEHHERILALDDLIEFLPRLPQIHDEPLADPVSVPLYFLSDLARQAGMVVCQAGEGADELFWGYPSWRTSLRLQRADELPIPAAAKAAALALLELAGASGSREYEFLRRGRRGLPIFWGGAEAFTEAQKRRLLSPALRSELDGLTSWDALQPIRARFEAAAWDPSALNWMTYLDLRLRLPELLLARLDRMSMAVGLEVRVPFLDHNLVELALSIPASAKTRGGTLKHLLKIALGNVLPEAVLNRPKQGFRVPVDDWLLGGLGDYARSEVRAFSRDSGLLDETEVESLLSAPRRETWSLLDLASWWRTYCT